MVERVPVEGDCWGDKFFRYGPWIDSTKGRFRFRGDDANDSMLVSTSGPKKEVRTILIPKEYT